MRALKIFILPFLFCCTGTLAQNMPLPAMKTKIDSASYGAGIYIAQWMMANGLDKYNSGLLLKGLNDRLGRQPLAVSDSTALGFVAAYRQEVINSIQKKFEDTLFASVRSKPDVKSLSNGILYIVRKQGKGLRPLESDSVVISFKGILPDGTIFEDTYQRGISVVTTPKMLIPGLNQSLQQMEEGSAWEIFIPSRLGYGDHSNGKVPPNSALIMLVELQAVKHIGP